MKTLISVLTFVLISLPAWGAPQLGPFEKGTAYNIYFISGESNYVVLEDAEIVRFEEIGGRSFVVVRSAGFSLQDDEGFILFDSVAAILPDKNFRVRQISSKGVPFYKNTIQVK